MGKDTGWGKRRFTVVNMQNTDFILLLFLIITLSICIRTVNLLFPTPVYLVVLSPVTLPTEKNNFEVRYFWVQI